MSLSTHVLDSVRGRPAAGVGVRLESARQSGTQRLAAATTDADGRIRELAAELPAGTYRLTFDTGAYFAELGQPAFYPEVTVSFTVTDPLRHHHVPLLLAPFAYSTYLGS
ncbi:MAG TPA: hydroxyisourate hydrolase [Pseudonocardia sp.]|jgi:5-hydroxyisourate hydrolase